MVLIVPKNLQRLEQPNQKAVSIGDFIHSSGDRRTLLIDGKQRMSTACMLGYVFSATRNFLLEIEHNGLAYRTDDHKQKEGQFLIKSPLLSYREKLKP